MESDIAIETRGLNKSFGSLKALDGAELQVPLGSVYGLLGPNGAGKTTLIRILATLLRPDSGSVYVLGHHVVHEANAVRAQVSLTGQFASIDEDLTGRENLLFLAKLLGYQRRAARLRAGELLEAFDLSEAASRSVKTYSGGMRRRLDIAASVVVRPRLLFLDEPTTGLDPRSRNHVWRIVRALSQSGTTVVLTTQYLEEADRIADHVAVIDHGRIIANGTPTDLKSTASIGRFDIHVRNVQSRSMAMEIITRVLGVAPKANDDPSSLVVSGSKSAEVVRALEALVRAGIELSSFSLGQPSLDEVFLELTGHRTAETEEPAT